MKALILASTLGLAFLANTAVAAVDSQEHSVWRNTEVKSVKAIEKNDKKWTPTQFSTVKGVDSSAKESKIWRKIRF